MTSTERARKRRDLMREEGYRAFLMYVSPDRLRYIEKYAQLQGMTSSAAFHELMDRQLVHLIDCMGSAEYLLAAGESDLVAKVFLDAHIAHTPPPTIEELATQFNKPSQ